MQELDALFDERDRLLGRQDAASLSKAYQEIVAEFLKDARTQSEFDKDVFTQLVDIVRVKSRDNIIFILKDGSEVKADTDGVEA